MNGFRSAALALGSMLALIACTGTETGNPADPHSPAVIALTARTSSPTDVSLRSAQGKLDVEQAFCVMTRLRIDDDGCAGAVGTELRIEGSHVIELTASSPFSAELGSMRASFCRLRIDIARANGALPANAPTELSGGSIVIKGHRADGVPFAVVSRAEREFEIRSRGGPFTIDDASHSLVLGFDVATWLANLGLDTLAAENGAVVVDDAHHRDVLDVFDSQVDRAMALYRDENDNSRLEDSETVSPLASAP